MSDAISALPSDDGHATLGPGERIVFKPYTREVFEQSFEWIGQHQIFPEAKGSGDYDRSTMS